MLTYGPRHTTRFVAASILLLLNACGGTGSTPSDPGPHPSPAPNGDFISLREDAATPVTFTEASGLPSVDCDPRVDWAAGQVVLWHDFTGSPGPNGYERFLNIIFPIADTIGTYTVHGDYLQAIYYNGNMYSASPLVSASNGTAIVTRSDSRIEGTYTFTVFDSTVTSSVQIEGSFGINAGWSLVCP